MRLSKAPLRISLGGGGTDLPAYANHYSGFCVVGTINRYVRVVDHHSPSGEYILHYRDTERVQHAEQIQHPLFRACLLQSPPTEIASFADLPGESGLGSSSAFAVAMCALRAGATQREAAAMASHVERKLLGEPIGQQDHYASALGGVRAFGFDGERVSILDRIEPPAYVALRDSLAIYPSGQYRKAVSVLTDQATKISDGAAMLAMHNILRIGKSSYSAIVRHDVDRYGALLHDHWETKRSVSPLMSSPDIDAQYRAARDAGVRGGKLMGAGGGGFWLFSVADEKRDALREAMATFDSRELAWNFDHLGVTVREGL